jgi:lysophospholipase L1-like esterase
MKEECDHQQAKLIVVGIPYLPQVYDDVWNSTFAGNAAYSRTAASERVEKLCRELGIAYVDTLEPMRERSRELGHWLHYAKDAHPTPEGQDVIADTVFKSRVVENRTLANLNR